MATFLLILIAAFVWLDARKRNYKSSWLYAIGTLCLGVFFIPLYLARRPLLENEVRHGGLVWNLCRGFALIWTATIILGACLCDYSSLLENQAFKNWTLEDFYIGIGLIWFAPLVVALVVGSLGKNDSIVEYGKPIKREGSLQADFLLLGKTFVCLFVLGIIVVCAMNCSSWFSGLYSSFSELIVSSFHKDSSNSRIRADSEQCLPSGILYYKDKEGYGYLLVNTNMTCSSRYPESYGYQGVASTSGDINSANWTDVISKDYLEHTCEIVTPNEVPKEWRIALESKLEQSQDKITEYERNKSQSLDSASNELTEKRIDTGITSSYLPTNSFDSSFDPFKKYQSDEKDQINDNQKKSIDPNVLIKPYQIANKRLETRLQELQNKLSEIEKAEAVKDSKIYELQKSIEVQNKALRSKAFRISELEDSLYSSHKRINRNYDDKTTTTTASAVQADSEYLTRAYDFTWPGIPDFYPVPFKQDVQKRLSMSTPYTSGFSHLRFSIDKQGIPRNIQLLAPKVTDSNLQNKYFDVIRRAGPFRPIISSQLEQINIDVELDLTDYVTVTQLSVSAFEYKI